jgi:hypothetical protein
MEEQANRGVDKQTDKQRPRKAQKYIFFRPEANGLFIEVSNKGSININMSTTK